MRLEVTESDSPFGAAYSAPTPVAPESEVSAGSTEAGPGAMSLERSRALTPTKPRAAPTTIRTPRTFSLVITATSGAGSEHAGVCEYSNRLWR